MENTEKMQPENKNTVKEPEFLSRYQAIISVPLSPENIDTYADSALDGLSALIADIEEKYQWEGLELSDKEREDKIFAEALPGTSVESALDRIDEVAQDLNGLDTLIEQTRSVPEQRVILVPDELPEVVIGGDGEGEWNRELKRLPKLKTALFVLEQDFGVDVRDPEQIKLSTGLVDRNMMRRTSYDAIELPELERFILSCDENGNKTFVFDTAKLGEVNITPEMLKNGTKSQIAELLEAKPEVGKSIIYSPNYVERIRSAIENPAGELVQVKEKAEQAEYLERIATTRMPDGYITYAKLSDELGDLGATRLRRLVSDCAEEIGTIEVFLIDGSRSARCLSPAQVQILKDRAMERSNEAPKGYLTPGMYAKERGLSAKAAKELVSKYGEDLGIMTDYYLPLKHEQVPYLSPEQQKILDSKLVPVAPEGYVQQVDIWKELGIGQSSLQNIISKCREELGELKTFSASKDHPAMAAVIYYSPEQQRIIKETYEKHADVPMIPDGYVHYGALMEKYNVSERLANKLIKRTSDQMGELKEYRIINSDGKPGKVMACFSPEQQRIFGEALAYQRAETKAGRRDFEHHRTVPEGYKNLSELSEYLGASRAAIRAHIKRLGDEVGEPEEYKNTVGTKYKYYSPEQIAIIEKSVKSSNRIGIGGRKTEKKGSSSNVDSDSDS